MKSEERRKRIEALDFYGLEDEAYALFSAVCGLAYQLSGTGMKESHALADQCVVHAEFLAARSKEWAEEEPLDPPAEIAKGHWGYA
jgi:hypothetical protein